MQIKKSGVYVAIIRFRTYHIEVFATTRSPAVGVVSIWKKRSSGTVNAIGNQSMNGCKMQPRAQCLWPMGGRGRPMHLVAYDVFYLYVNIHLYYYTNVFCFLILSLRKYVCEQ